MNTSWLHCILYKLKHAHINDGVSLAVLCSQIRERQTDTVYNKRIEVKDKFRKQNDKVYENIEQFLPLIWKYTGITELTPYILNELIEKIVVHEKAVGLDGVKTQQVDIYYKFVGCINQRRDGGCTGEVIKADEVQPGSCTRLPLDLSGAST